MEATLMLIEPRGETGPIVTLPLPATVGRAEDADLQVEDGWASRRHCRLDEVDGALVVRDLGSKHGTLVNRRIVSEWFLQPGDEIMVGMTCLKVKPDGTVVNQS